jgi:hypothetical protein
VTDAVLDAAEGVEELGFEGDGGVQAAGEAVEFDQGGSADGFDDVRVYRHLSSLSFCFPN